METQRHSNLELTNGGYIPYQAGLLRHTYLSLGLGSYKAWTGRQETGTFGGGSREFRSRSRRELATVYQEITVATRWSAWDGVNGNHHGPRESSKFDLLFEIAGTLRKTDRSHAQPTALACSNLWIVFIPFNVTVNSILRSPDFGHILKCLRFVSNALTMLSAGLDNLQQSGKHAESEP